MFFLSFSYNYINNLFLKTIKRVTLHFWVNINNTTFMLFIQKHAQCALNAIKYCLVCSLQTIMTQYVTFIKI